MAKKAVKKNKPAATEDSPVRKRANSGKAAATKLKAKKTGLTTRRKTAGGETAVTANTVQRNTTYLTDEQLTYFRRLLLEKLAEITGDVSHIESGALNASRADASGDLSSMPIHMADIGSDNYEQEFALGLMNSERQIVGEIVAALKRIEDRTYGICEGTGEPIPLTRLNGIPWTRYCLRYAALAEKTHQNQQAASESEQSPPQEAPTSDQAEADEQSLQ